MIVFRISLYAINNQIPLPKNTLENLSLVALESGFYFFTKKVKNRGGPLISELEI
jgi:hypothetical protein